MLSHIRFKDRSLRFWMKSHISAHSIRRELPSRSVSVMIPVILWRPLYFTQLQTKRMTLSVIDAMRTIIEFLSSLYLIIVLKEVTQQMNHFFLVVYEYL